VVGEGDRNEAEGDGDEVLTEMRLRVKRDRYEAEGDRDEALREPGMRPRETPM
jgi:hypothetical protein